MRNVNFHLDKIRTKWGLIGGLGHLVKFITGNLDSQDGQRYDFHSTMHTND